jgi:phosphoserine phosphatase RsbU/P
MNSSPLPRVMEPVAPGTPLANRLGNRRIEAIDLHAVSLPARTFTGDFYFAHRGGDGIWIALGDIAGKGLPAAVVMAMAQEELERLFAECLAASCEPAMALQRLQVLLRPLLPSNRFATAVIGHLHDDGTLVIANAGHCAPLIARTDGRVEPIAPTGPVVGMLDNPRWASVTTILEKGETLLLYSDGVVEARSQEDEEFGLAQVVTALSSAALEEVGARELTGRILAEVNRHASGSRDDDLTVVAVRRPLRAAVGAHAG